MKNNDIRLYAAGKGIKLWMLAEALCITDATLSRKLRKEWTPEQKAEARRLIDEIAESRR